MIKIGKKQRRIFNIHKYSLKQGLKRQGLSLGIPFICGLLLFLFTVFYFRAYARPYMQTDMINISEGWQYYSEDDSELQSMDILQQVDIPAGKPLILTRILKEEIPEAYLMFKSNHQRIKLYLEGKLLFDSPVSLKGKNPGMALHFVALPKEYNGKLLQVELTSPYGDYSGAPGSIYLGTIASLEAYALSRSMLHTLLMVLCLAAGVFIMVLALWHKKSEKMDMGNFFFGVFSMFWGFYFPSSDFTAHQFFDPQGVSDISIGLYFLYPLPLLLYFYYQFTVYRKAFLPVVILRGVFIAAAYVMYVTGRADLPEMLGINNPLYVLSIVYMIGLGFAELKKGNRFLKFTIPWILLTFLISMQSMVSFYTTRIRQDETLYEMVFFMLIMIVWVYNVREFFHEKAREKSDNQVLRLKNELMLESYDNTVKHLEQVGVLRHEMKNHVIAMQILMEGGEYEKTRCYLSGLAEQQDLISKVRYCEHYLLNAIVSTRLSGLKEAGIEVFHNIAVPKKLHIPDGDLSSLLMNILDNALEAVSEVQTEDKWLELKIFLKKSYLYIYCKNVTDNRFLYNGTDYLSTKENPENHGHGLRIIRQIVNKHGGILNISHTAHTFTLEAAIKEEAD